MPTIRDPGHTSPHRGGWPERPRAPGMQCRVRGEVGHLKVAVTPWFLLIVTLQVSEVPLHAPPHPTNTTFLLDGLAVRVTLLPLLKLAEHRVPQLMPLGLLVTLPAPLVTTLKLYFDGAGAGVKVAVTDAAAFSAKLQAPVPVQAPLQPLNTMPASGVAVRLTCVPDVERRGAGAAAVDADAADLAGARAGLGGGERELLLVEGRVDEGIGIQRDRAGGGASASATVPAREQAVGGRRGGQRRGAAGVEGHGAGGAAVASANVDGADPCRWSRHRAGTAAARARRHPPAACRPCSRSCCRRRSPATVKA